MTQLLGFLLTLLVTYGYTTIALVIFLSGFGLPLPATAIILAAGSFTVDGTLDFWSVVLLITFTASFGDLMSYLVARTFSHWVTGSVHHIGIRPHHLTRVDSYLERHGKWYIFFSRWLITPLGPPVNIAAGLRHYPLPLFVAIGVAGEFVWAFLATYLGYVFGASWSTLLSLVTTAPDVLALLAIAIATASIAWRIHRRRAARSK